MDLDLLNSPWSQPLPDMGTRAFDFHLTALTKWLTSAGAEARFGLVLCSGPAARTRLESFWKATAVKVELTPATNARPLHPAVVEHQGDHFNRTLFLMDIEGDDDELIFADLEAKRSQLARMATWVFIVITDPAQLATLVRVAPGLYGEVLRTCLALDDEAANATGPVVEPEALALWHAQRRMPELVFADAMRPTEDTDYLAFSRLLRSGYAGTLKGASLHPERARLLKLWQGDDPGMWRSDPLVFPAAEAQVASAEGALRHFEGLSEAARATLLATLSDVPAARVAVGASVEDAAYVAFAALNGGDLGALGAARDAAGAVGPGLRAHVELVGAAAAAGQGDLDTTDACLTEAAEYAKVEGVAPELCFEIYEKLVQLRLFQQRRPEALALIDVLRAMSEEMASPLFAARFLFARGTMLGSLDAGRAKNDLYEASRLFADHGYPKQAKQANRKKVS